MEPLGWTLGAGVRTVVAGRVEAALAKGAGATPRVGVSASLAGGVGVALDAEAATSNGTASTPGGCSAGGSALGLSHPADAITSIATPTHRG